MTPGGRGRPALTLLALLLAACRPEAGRLGLKLADFVPFQADNVTTAHVAPGRNEQLLGDEWWIAPAEPFRLATVRSSIRFFIADDPARALGIEARSPTRAAVRILLNGRALTRLALDEGFEGARVALPADRQRIGWNLLELRHASPGTVDDATPWLEVRSVSFRPAAGRSPARITRRDGRRDAAVEMPAASYLDIVTVPPGEARFVGSFTVRPGTGRDDRIGLTLTALDDGGAEQTLERAVFSTAARGRWSVDLSGFAGRPTRLRLQVSGPDGALVSWRGAGIEGRRPSRSVRKPSEKRGRPGTGPPTMEGVDVVAVLMDAARADAFGAFGAADPTPSIDRLAAEGTLFARALAPAPWTAPSVAGTLTGLAAEALGFEGWTSRLPDAVPTLAERLARAGYDTLLWSQHPLYRNHRTLTRGFARTVLTPRGQPYGLPASGDLFRSDRPTFAWIHLLPPHAPYEPPPPFRGRLTADCGSGPEPEPAFLNQFPDRLQPASLAAEDLACIRGRYLEHAAFADHLVGRLLATLKDAGRYDQTLVVVLADHGEGFLEHGRFLHTRLLYDEFLRVPLVVKWPGSAAGFRARVEETVSLLDLAPALAAALAADASAQPTGSPLLGLAFGGADPARPVYAATRGTNRRRRPGNPLRAVELDGWKAIWDPLRDTLELYRPAEDPAEQRDLAARHPARALLLRQHLLRLRHAHATLLRSWGGPLPAEELDPKTEERLRALGYL